MTLLADAPLTLDDADLEAATAAPPVMAHRRPARVLRAVGVLVVIGSVVVAVLAVHALRRRDALSTARDRAATAARTEAAAMTSYDYRTIGADFAAVTAGATGTFKTDFAKTSALLAPMVTKSRAVAKGTVRDVAVEQVSRSAATVLVFVDQSVTSTNASADQTLTSRLRMTLVRVHGQWLVSAVDLV